MGNSITYFNYEDCWGIFNTDQGSFKSLKKVSTKNHPFFGQITIWRCEERNSQYFSKISYGSVQDDKEVMIANHQKRCSLKHPNLLKYFGCTLYERYEFTVNVIECHSLFEYPNYSLNDVIEVQKRNFFFMREKQILDLITDLSSTLDYMHQNDSYHGDLCPQNIYIDQQTQKCKISDPTGLIDPNVIGFKKFLTTRQQVFLSPEQMQDLKQKRTQYSTNFRSSDVYALGLTILQIVSQQSSFDLFNYQFCTINEQLLKQRLEASFVGNYTYGLMDLVISMLKRNSMQRPTASQIWHSVQLLKSQSDLNNSHSLRQSPIRQQAPQQSLFYSKQTPSTIGSRMIKMSNTRSTSVLHTIREMEEPIKYIRPSVPVTATSLINRQQMSASPMKTPTPQSRFTQNINFLSNNNTVSRVQLVASPKSLLSNTPIQSNESLKKLEDLTLRADRALLNSKNTINKFKL